MKKVLSAYAMLAAFRSIKDNSNNRVNKWTYQVDVLAVKKANVLTPNNIQHFAVVRNSINEFQK